MGLPGGSVVNPPATAGDAKDTGSIPGSGRSPGVGKWQLAPVSLPGKFSGWGGSWRPAVYVIAKELQMTEQFEHIHTKYIKDVMVLC